jgi:hypothetical protein
MLTPEQIAGLYQVLVSRGVIMNKCSVCEAEKEGLHGVLPSLSVIPLVTTGTAAGCVATCCTHCGYIRQHNLSTLGVSVTPVGTPSKEVSKIVVSS